MVRMQGSELHQTWVCITPISTTILGSFPYLVSFKSTRTRVDEERKAYQQTPFVLELVDIYKKLVNMLFSHGFLVI